MGLAAALVSFATLRTIGPLAIEVRTVPRNAESPTWLKERAQAQQKAFADSQINYNFRFEDIGPESSIAFRHRVVDDAGPRRKAVHYDHGNGLAAADIDGDDLIDLFFINQVGANGLWKNVGEGRFVDVTAAAGVAMADAVKVSASFADVDNDGATDLYITTVKDGNRLFLNDGKGRFREVKDSGLEYKGHSSGATFFDFDHDGLIDLFLSNVGNYTTDERRPVFIGPNATEDQPRFYCVGRPNAFRLDGDPAYEEPSRLFHSLGGGRFEDVTDRMGISFKGWSGDASPIDANDDGWPDLYILNMSGPDAYFENDNGKRFVERPVFRETPNGSMGIKVFDLDNDGRLDLYVTDMHSDMPKEAPPENEGLKSNVLFPGKFPRQSNERLFGNAFFKKLGANRYEEISDRIGAENFWPWGMSVGDLNADGYDDVFVTASMNYPFRYQSNMALMNIAGRELRDAAFVLGIEPRRDGRTTEPWFLLDCWLNDADTDLCADGVNFARYLSVLGTKGSRSSVIADIDNDGDLDIVTSEFGGRPMVLISDLAQAKGVRFVKVKLKGTSENRDGLGAVVSVEAGSRTLTKVNDGKSGYLSQSRIPLYFGLDDAESVTRITVRWPSSGKTQILEGPIAAGRLVTIEER